MPKYVRQILTALKGETEGDTMIGGDFSVSPSIKESFRQKVGQETEEWN